MRETCLVEIFCELDLEVYNKAVGESISKLAFEAVEKIIQVDRWYYNWLTGLKICIWIYLLGYYLSIYTKSCDFLDHNTK